jgi:vitamin B12 transporter
LASTAVSLRCQGWQINLGWQPTGTIALKERLAHGFQVYSSYGKYVRYPSFYEIYGDGINIIARSDSLGNTQELLPEVGRTFDAGFGWDGIIADKLSGHSRLTYFQRNTDNNITLIQTPGASYYTNTGETYQHGLEFEGSTHYGSFASLQSAVTVQNGWYPGNAYYNWGTTVPMIAAPGWRIPTLNAPHVTGDARLDLHFFRDKLTTYFEAKYKGRNVLNLYTPANISNGEQPVYDGIYEYEHQLTTFDLGAHWKLPYNFILSGGVTDLLNHGPKQTLGATPGTYGIPGYGLSGDYEWWSCNGQIYSSYSAAGQNCAPYQITTYNYTFPVRQNVYFPEQGRTLYINLAETLNGFHRRGKGLRDDK